MYKESPKMCSLSHLTGQTASRPVTLLSFSGILFTFLHCITASSGPSSNGLHTTMWCIKQMKKTLTLSDSIIKKTCFLHLHNRIARPDRSSNGPTPDSFLTHCCFPPLTESLSWTSLSWQHSNRNG